MTVVRFAWCTGRLCWANRGVGVLLDRLTDVLTFEQVEGDRFVADPFGDKTATRAELASDDRLDYPESWEGPPFFQGCYSMALALVVAGSTVGEELVPLSTHSAFPRAGVSTEPVEISVERDSDSRRFARRRVRLCQRDRVFFWSDICFHRHDPDDGWQQPPTDMPPPGEMGSAPIFVPVPVMEARPSAGPASSVLDDVVFPTWVRFPAGIPTAPIWGAAAQAWASDYYVGYSMLLASGRSPRQSGALTLEHSMWFHRPVDPAEWLLVNMTPASLADQRYLATGSIHTESGVLASTIAQAGIFLPDPGF
jgi:acyl-CoA thioesterase II